VATLVAVSFVEKSGRRKLLLIGISLMLVALVVLTGAFWHYQDDGVFSARKGIIIAAMFVYIGGYQVGPSSLPPAALDARLLYATRGNSACKHISQDFSRREARSSVPSINHEEGCNYQRQNHVLVRWILTPVAF
jgi:hypothetical protein